mgnify:CR=1 FL=1
MPIQVWLARMERPLPEQEYGDTMALLPDARRERLEKLPKESKNSFSISRKRSLQ